MNSGGDADNELAFVVIGIAAAAFSVYVGAALAAFITDRSLLHADGGDALHALFALARRRSEPRLAWPAGAHAQLPGPALYWFSTLVAFAGVMSATVLLWSRLSSSRIGLARRQRLGVDVRGRMARVRDLRPLIVKGPVRGRFVLGRVHGRLVAAQHPDPPSRGWRGARHNATRSAVAVIGPSQCGKTSNVVCSILEWDGPAILSSVKNDLLENTATRRMQLGEVYVFDPLGEVDPSAMPEGSQRCGWSPLQSAATVGGAMAVASSLLDAAPAEGMTNATYWTRKGEALLWPVLFAAAVGGHAMSDVVRWLSLQDGELRSRDPQAPAPSGEVRSILQSAIKQIGDEQLSSEARFALQQFDGFWLLNDRMRSDIFSTAQTLVQPWEDPRLARASALTPRVDLPWLLAGTGRNTLYVSQPLRGAERLGVVFGGLLGDIVADQAYEVAKRSGCALPELLVVIDEAGNTPVRWLPQVASTCSGIGMSLVTVWQSKSQIDARYQSLSDSVLTNHATKLFFAGTSDESTGKYASFLAGEEEVQNKSEQRDTRRAGRSTGLSTARVALIPPSVVRRAKPANALLVHGTLPPAHLVGRVLKYEPALQRVARGEQTPPNPTIMAPRLSEALKALRADRAHSIGEPPLRSWDRGQDPANPDGATC